MAKMLSDEGLENEDKEASENKDKPVNEKWLALATCALLHAHAFPKPLRKKLQLQRQKLRLQRMLNLLLKRKLEKKLAEEKQAQPNAVEEQEETVTRMKIEALAVEKSRRGH